MRGRGFGRQFFRLNGSITRFLVFKRRTVSLLRLPTLAVAARDAVTARFTAVVASPDFLRMPAAWLESLLAADGLNVEKFGVSTLRLKV